MIVKASEALDKKRRKEQRENSALKGMRWNLLKSRDALTCGKYCNANKSNFLRATLLNWITCVNRSKVNEIKSVAKMIKGHLQGIVSWARTRINNGFLEALNGLFQAAKRKAPGYRKFQTIKTVIFLLAGKLNFSKVNHHLNLQPT